MNHYCVYTRDITPEFIEDLREQDIQYELHLNRVRLWLSEDSLHLVFSLKWSGILHNIDHEQDHALGR